MPIIHSGFVLILCFFSNELNLTFTMMYSDLNNASNKIQKFLFYPDFINNPATFRMET